MKYLKMLGLAAVAATAMAAFTAGSASATTLEVKGVKQTGSVTITTSLKAGTSAILRDTFGFSQNTCTSISGSGKTAAPYTGATVTGVGENAQISSCTNEPVIAHKTGTLHISHIAGTTNGTVTSSGAVITTPSPFGTLTCLTGNGTHLGILTGSAAGHAELLVNAQFGCSGISSRMVATFTVTSPTGLGVVA